MTSQEQANEWAKGIKARLGDELYRLLWQESLSIVQRQWPDYEPSDSYLFFCGYLLGPPGVMECYSLSLTSPLPTHPARDREAATAFYRAGIAARVATL